MGKGFALCSILPKKLQKLQAAFAKSTQNCHFVYQFSRKIKLHHGFVGESYMNSAFLVIYQRCPNVCCRGGLYFSWKRCVTFWIWRSVGVPWGFKAIISVYWPAYFSWKVPGGWGLFHDAHCITQICVLYLKRNSDSRPTALNTSVMIASQKRH